MHQSCNNIIAHLLCDKGRISIRFFVKNNTIAASFNCAKTSLLPFFASVFLDIPVLGHLEVPLLSSDSGAVCQ